MTRYTSFTLATTTVRRRAAPPSAGVPGTGARTRACAPCLALRRPSSPRGGCDVSVGRLVAIGMMTLAHPRSPPPPTIQMTY
jgi:hypothetical protein